MATAALPITAGALFDPTGAYRYRLWREWDASLPAVTFVMLNPSTADAAVDDPTIRRCIGFARCWGFGRLEVVNLFALRSSDPKVLASHANPIGPDNDAHLWDAVLAVATVVAAWGIHGAIRNRGEQVGATLPPCTLELGRTGSGQPRHPLYVRHDAHLRQRPPEMAETLSPQTRGLSQANSRVPSM